MTLPFMYQIEPESDCWIFQYGTGWNDRIRTCKLHLNRVLHCRCATFQYFWLRISESNRVSSGYEPDVLPIHQFTICASRILIFYTHDFDLSSCYGHCFRNESSLNLLLLIRCSFRTKRYLLAQRVGTHLGDIPTNHLSGLPVMARTSILSSLDRDNKQRLIKNICGREGN